MYSLPPTYQYMHAGCLCLIDPEKRLCDAVSSALSCCAPIEEASIAPLIVLLMFLMS